MFEYRGVGPMFAILDRDDRTGINRRELLRVGGLRACLRNWLLWTRFASDIISSGDDGIPQFRTEARHGDRKDLPE